MAWVRALVAVAGAWIAGIAPAAADGPPRAIQITSPLGRSGLPGKVRIVARVSPGAQAPAQVRFYIGEDLLATDTDGPPFVAEWTDDNPFEARRIRAEMDDGQGSVVADVVELKPFELVEATDVMSVSVDASVRDARGRYVRGLHKADFAVFEDEVGQAVDAAVADSLPTTFALLIDSSQSMARNIDFVRRAVAEFPRLLGSDDDAMVAPFTHTVTSITGPTRDAPTLTDAVAAIRPGGTTGILDGLTVVAGQFVPGERRRAVVLLTDAYDEASTSNVDDVVAALKKAQVIVYTVAVGGVSGVSLRGEALLRRIAEQTGGRAFFPWNSREVAAAYAAIVEDAQHRYRVTYTPTNQRHDGQWRTIRLSTVDRSLAVLARAGYQAPEPKPVRATLEFTLTDAQHQPVDVVRDELQVIEDGVAQSVESFHEAVAPVSVVLALDASGSMTRVAPAVQEAAHLFADALKPGDPLGLVVFADRAELVHDLTPARWVSHRAIQAYAVAGGTALYDGLVESMTRLQTVQGRRVVVVVTDGRDENASSTGAGSARGWDDVLALARASGATVYAIGLGTRVDRARLEQLTALTGGETYVTADVGELSRHYQRIVDELRRRYVVAYISTNSTRDGAWRQVDIRPANPAVRARSAGGYFAPSH